MQIRKPLLAQSIIWQSKVHAYQKSMHQKVSVLQDRRKAMTAHCRFLLYLAFMPALVGLCSMPFVNNVPYTQKSELSTQPQLCTSGKMDDLHLCNNDGIPFAAQLAASKKHAWCKPILLFWCH